MTEKFELSCQYHWSKSLYGMSIIIDILLVIRKFQLPLILFQLLFIRKMVLEQALLIFEEKTTLKKEEINCKHY